MLCWIFHLTTLTQSRCSCMDGPKHLPKTSDIINSVEGFQEHIFFMTLHGPLWSLAIQLLLRRHKVWEPQKTSHGITLNNWLEWTCCNECLTCARENGLWVMIASQDSIHYIYNSQYQSYTIIHVCPQCPSISLQIVKIIHCHSTKLHQTESQDAKDTWQEATMFVSHPYLRQWSVYPSSFLPHLLPTAMLKTVRHIRED